MNWPSIPRCDWKYVAKMGVGGLVMAGVIALMLAFGCGCASPKPYQHPLCPTCGQRATSNELWHTDLNGHRWMTEAGVEENSY